MPTFIFAGKKNGNTPYLKEERSDDFMPRAMSWLEIKWGPVQNRIQQLLWKPETVKCNGYT